MSGSPRWWRLALAAVAAALFFPPAAGAHAVLTGSSPADGTRLERSPHTIVLHFNEGVSPRFRSVQLVDREGHPVPGVRLRSATGPASNVAVELPKLRRGAYALAWRVLSEDDGHTTTGSVVFGVRTAVAQRAHPVAADVPPAPIDVALRWLRFSLVALLIGGVAFVAIVLRAKRTLLEPDVLRIVRGRALALAQVCGVLAIVVHLAVFARQASVVHAWGGSDDLRELAFSSRWGTLWLAELLFLVVFAALVLGARRERELIPLTTTVACAVCVTEIVAMDALGSHAAALPARAAPVVATGVHLLAASVWLGVVAAFVVALWPTRALTLSKTRSIAVELRRPVALIAGSTAIATLVSGLYLAGVEVTSVDALLLTFYGQVLLAKAGLVAVIGALGALNFLLLQRLARAGRGRIVRATIVAEAVLGTAVFLAAGVLTAAAPARGPAFAQARQPVPMTLSRQVADVIVTLTVRPNRPGTNTISVVAASTRRPSPQRIDSVQLQLESSRRVAASLRRVAGGGWLTLAALGRLPAERLTVIVNRGGARLSAPFQWRVAAADQTRPVVVSSRRLAPLTDGAAIALVFVASLGLALAIGLGRRFRARSHAYRTSRLEGLS